VLEPKNTKPILLDNVLIDCNPFSIKLKVKSESGNFKLSAKRSMSLIALPCVTSNRGLLLPNVRLEFSNPWWNSGELHP
jgi:hypothetical protein